MIQVSTPTATTRENRTPNASEPCETHKRHLALHPDTRTDAQLFRCCVRCSFGHIAYASFGQRQLINNSSYNFRLATRFATRFGLLINSCWLFGGCTQPPSERRCRHVAHSWQTHRQNGGLGGKWGMTTCGAASMLPRWLTAFRGSK